MFWNRDRTSSEWTRLNKILRNGQWGFETDTGKAKLGDGDTRWNDLAYFSGGGGGSANLLAPSVSQLSVYSNTPQTIVPDPSAGTKVIFDGSATIAGDDLTWDAVNNEIVIDPPGSEVGLYSFDAEIDWAESAEGHRFSKLHFPNELSPFNYGLADGTKVVPAADLDNVSVYLGHLLYTIPAGTRISVYAGQDTSGGLDITYAELDVVRML
jgi:hypothetical protein